MTEFRNHVCWYPKRVAEVLADGIAERISPADRAATHFPLPMRRMRLLFPKSGQMTLEEGESATAQEFLKEFLGNPSASLAAAILGDAGTGKTHLLKWVQSHLPNSKDSKVIVIPRKDVGLPGVVALLVEGLPGKRFEDIREKVSQAAANMTPALAKELIANSLAAYVRHGSDPVSGDVDQCSIAQDYLRPNLPDLLLDRAFVDHLTGIGGPFSAIWDHLTAWKGGKASEDPMAFDAGMLCKALRGMQPRAEKVAGDLRQEPTLAKLAAVLCNHELRRAIQGQVAQGVMSNIGELLEEVRREYAIQGKKIILLFEDLARAQFIDEELVLACVADVRPDGPKLAPLRTLFACTTGMFLQLRDTVAQRIQGPVVTLNDRESVEDRSIARGVAARYLNAVRTPTNEVQRWFELSRGQEQALVSVCNDCPHKVPCHAAFGEYDGVGLFPFNEVALDRLARARVGGRFVARQFVTKVLYETLDHAAKAIATGEHPTEACLRDVEAARAEIVKTASLVSATESERWVRMVRLYGSDSVAAEQSVSGDLAGALGLTLTSKPSRFKPTEPPKPDQFKPTEPPRPVPIQPPPPPIEKRLMEWASDQGRSLGVRLLQSDVSNMRMRLRSLVLDSLPTCMGSWSNDVLEGLFPPNSINFVRMDIASDADQVNVPVLMPAEDTEKHCHSIVFRYLAAQAMHEGLGAVEAGTLWTKVSSRDYLDLANFAHDVGLRVVALASGALGGRRQAARLAVAGAAWARLERGLAVDGRDGSALAASVMAEDTPAPEREALLAVVGFQKGDKARSTLIDGALLRDAADQVMSEVSPNLLGLKAPREPASKALLGGLLDRSRKAAQGASRKRMVAHDEVLHDIEFIEEQFGGVPTSALRQASVVACEGLLDTVSRVAPWDHSLAFALRNAIAQFKDCRVERARTDFEEAKKAVSDIDALLRLHDRSFCDSLSAAKDFLSKASALAKHAEDVCSRPPRSSDGITLDVARKATLDASASLRDSMATIEDGEVHVG